MKSFKLVLSLMIILSAGAVSGMRAQELPAGDPERPAPPKADEGSVESPFLWTNAHHLASWAMTPVRVLFPTLFFLNSFPSLTRVSGRD